MKNGILISIVSVLLFFVLWQIVSQLSIVPDTFISSPGKILFKIQDFWSSGIFSKHVLYSIYLLVVAISLSILFGTIIGILLYRYPLLYVLSRPLIYTLNALPIIVVAPLVILWFGFESISKIIIIIIASIPVVILNTYFGAKNTDTDLLIMAQSFNLREIHIIKSIVLYSSLPNIFAGIRIMIGRSIVGVVIADLFGYGVGLGYLINFFNSTSDTTGLFAITLVLLGINYIFTLFFDIIKKLIIKKLHYKFE